LGAAFPRTGGAGAAARCLACAGLGAPRNTEARSTVCPVIVDCSEREASGGDLGEDFFGRRGPDGWFRAGVVRGEVVLGIMAIKSGAGCSIPRPGRFSVISGAGVRRGDPGPGGGGEVQVEAGTVCRPSLRPRRARGWRRPRGSGAPVGLRVVGTRRAGAGAGTARSLCQDGVRRLPVEVDA
jgi:hypothetical protein